MKKSKALVLALGFILAQAGIAAAAVSTSATFNLTTILPVASAVNFNTSKVINAGLNKSDWTALSGTSGQTLDFGSLTFNSTLGIYTAGNFFAIDVAPVGAGSESVTFTYTAGPAVTGAIKTLGDAVVVTTYKEVFDPVAQVSTETQINAATGATLKNVSTLNTTAATLAGGWLRAYIGISTGDATKAGVPFTSADAPGNYTATLLITATPQ